MKTFISFLLLSLPFIASCSLLDSEKSAPPDGWFEVKVRLGEQENAYNITDLYFLNRNIGWIVGRKTAENGQRAYVGFTENGGDDWDFKFIENYTELSSVHFFDRKKGVTADRVTHFTNNGGATWTHFLIPEGEVPGGIFDGAFGSPANGWGVGPFGTVARSTDAGKTWTYLDLGYNEVRFKSAEAFGEQYTWIVSSDLLLRTIDGGKNWQEINLQNAVDAPPVRYNNITFTDARQGWAVGDFRRILHTEDGGQSWEVQYPKTEQQHSFDSFTSISAYDSLNVLAVTGHGAILRTSDGGQSWREQLPAKDEGGSFHSVQFVDPTVAYAAGIGPAGVGRLMKTVTCGEKDAEE